LNINAIALGAPMCAGERCGVNAWVKLVAPQARGSAPGLPRRGGLTALRGLPG
jgi:hypothetical protein